MTLFLRKILHFIWPIALVYGTVIVLVFCTDGRQCKELPYDDNTSTVFLGDSHIECAFNDSLVQNTKNLARSSESYFYTYAKLRYLLKELPAIKTVVVGFSYHNTGEYIDDFTFGNQSSEKLSTYFSLLKANDKFVLLSKNPDIVGDKQVLLTGLKNFYDCQQYSGLSFTGGFLKLQTDKALNETEIQERIVSQYYKSKSETGFAAFNIRYLDKIVALCAEKQIVLILALTPLHERYKMKVPSKFIKKYNEIANRHERRATIINMNDLVDLEDKHFLPDGDHVTVEGASITTEALNNYIEDMN